MGFIINLVLNTYFSITFILLENIYIIECLVFDVCEK